MSETVAVAMATAHCNTLFAARPPMLAAASKPVKASGGKEGGGGDAKTHRTERGGGGVCGGIRRNANDPLPEVCPSLCGRRWPGRQREGVHVRVNTTCMYRSENIPRRVCARVCVGTNISHTHTHTPHTHTRSRSLRHTKEGRCLEESGIIGYKKYIVLMPLIWI